ncbi:MAG TPA: ATP-binding protein [Vicinamibacterales bacterium]|nr:ATP-binding protein [Vicinamibacterales bacterium]
MEDPLHSAARDSTRTNVERDQSDLATDQFLATMTHELRTPLNAILGFTGTLLMKLPGPLTQDQEQQLRTVKTSTKHLLALINDLIALAKIEAGRMKLRLSPIDGQQAIDEVIAELRPLAEARGLTLQSERRENQGLVRADPHVLSQILNNLTHNAIRFTARGDVRLDMGPSPVDERMIDFQVCDTGIGIMADDQDKLFTAFAQFSTSTGDREGTGLGLLLSQKLAELVGGSIRFTSEVGKGSTFILSLPRG